MTVFNAPNDRASWMSRVHVTGTFTAREVPWDLHVLYARDGFGQTVLERAGKGYCPGDCYTILFSFLFFSLSLRPFRSPGRRFCLEVDR